MIRRGDTVVYAKKPGILMTAISDPEQFGGRSVVTCKWQEGKNKRRQYEYGIFEVSALTKEAGKIEDVRGIPYRGR